MASEVLFSLRAEFLRSQVRHIIHSLDSSAVMCEARLITHVLGSSEKEDRSAPARMEPGV